MPTIASINATAHPQKKICRSKDVLVHTVAVEVIMLRTTELGLSVLEAEDDNN